MILQIAEDYRISSDTQSWMIEKRTIPQTGKNAGIESWSTVSWHPSFDLAAKSVTDRMLRESPAEGIEEIRAAVACIKAMVASAINGGENHEQRT